MKTIFKSLFSSAGLVLGTAVCANAIVMPPPAQNLFAADFYNGNIYEITPGGTPSTFVSGLGMDEAVGLGL